MSMETRRIDDLALCEIFKLVDPSTLMRCRLVNKKWNREIIRLNKFTKKFNTYNIILELSGDHLVFSKLQERTWKTYTEPCVSPETVRAALRHLAPPKILNIILEWQTTQTSYDDLIAGLNHVWCRHVKELEIVSYSPVAVSRIISDMKIFPNIFRLSLSHYCIETLSCAYLFKQFPHLRFCRIFSFTGNDGSDESSGLIFDDAAIDALLENQLRNRRLIQRIELYNTDILFCLSTFVAMLKKLSRTPINHSLEEQLFFHDPNEPHTIHLLFDSCHWRTTNEPELLTAITHIATNFRFPIHRNSLRGDYQFTINSTIFVLKFVAGSVDE